MAGLLTVQECGEKQQELLDDIEVINETCKKDKREPDKEEQATIDAKLDEIDQLEAQKKKAKRYEETRASLSTRQGEPVGLQIDDTATESEKPKTWDVPIKQLIKTRPRNFKGEVLGLSAEKRAYAAGQFFLACAAMQMPGRYRRPKAVDWCKNNLGVDLYNVMGEGDGDTSGAGFFVPDQITTDIIRLKEMYGVARRLFRPRPMTSDYREDPRETSQMTAYWVGENQTLTESEPGYDNVSLRAKKLTALTRYSRELDADSLINLGDELTGQIAWSLAYKEDLAAFNGAGEATNGGIHGIRPRLLAIDPTGTGPLVAQGTGNTLGAIVLGDFEKVVSLLPIYADTPMTAWLCNKVVYYQVMVKLMLASGGVPAAEIRDGMRTPIFLGYPVIFSQVFPSTTAVNTVFCTLADYSIGCSFGMRSGIEISFSEQATVGGQSLWERNQVGVRAIERIDINVHSVGTATVPGPIVGLRTGS